MVLNIFTYCLNNPLKYSDPFGMLMAPADFGREIDAYQNWLCDVAGSYHYTGGGVGGGWFGAAGSINTAYFFYSGDVNKFSQYSLEGKSTVFSFSVGEGASFGRSIILMKDNYGAVIIGIGTSIGAGGSPTVGSGQITIQNTHIWR